MWKVATNNYRRKEEDKVHWKCWFRTVLANPAQGFIKALLQQRWCCNWNEAFAIGVRGQHSQAQLVTLLGGLFRLPSPRAQMANIPQVFCVLFETNSKTAKCRTINCKCCNDNHPRRSQHVIYSGIPPVLVTALIVTTVWALKHLLLWKLA